MPALAFLGTGIMRIVNIGLLVLLAGALIFGAYKAFTGHYVDVGRNQVTNEVNAQNNALDNEVNAVDTRVIHDVTHTTDIVTRNSHDVEVVIRNSPSEPLSNVSRNRLDVVYNQQQSIREASQGSK